MSSEIDNDELVFADEDDQSISPQSNGEKWQVLIVDDEEQVHLITKLALKNFEFEGKNLEITSAFSTSEAKDLLQTNAYALVLLDVVIEERNSGLELVKYIREELCNNSIRIVLRTGQPGDAPEEKVIAQYDIDEYKLKTELTHTKMFTTVIVALRSYDRLMALRRISDELHEKNMELINFNDRLEKTVEERTLALKKSNQELETAIKEKRNLIRILSHDLNNYINVIFTAVALSAKYAASVPEKVGVILGKIKRAAENQRSLIAHIVEIEALSSGKKHLELKPVSLLSTYEQGEFVFRDKLLAKELSLQLECNIENPMVLADPILLSNSVFNNILSNAIKFSPNGAKIRVEISTHSPSILCLSIRDHGIGMPENLKKDIFSADKATSRVGTAGEQGTGFGMPLVKTYVEQFGGSISLESSEKSIDNDNHGTCFHVMLKEAKQN